MQKDLKQITARTGLQTAYDDESDGIKATVTVWRDDTQDAYVLVFSHEDEEYQREVVTVDELEDKMRELQKDLRKWRKVTR